MKPLRSSIRIFSGTAGWWYSLMGMKEGGNLLSVRARIHPRHWCNHNLQRNISRSRAVLRRIPSLWWPLPLKCHVQPFEYCHHKAHWRCASIALRPDGLSIPFEWPVHRSLPDVAGRAKAHCIAGRDCIDSLS